MKLTDLIIGDIFTYENRQKQYIVTGILVDSKTHEIGGMSYIGIGDAFGFFKLFDQSKVAHVNVIGHDERKARYLADNKAYIAR